MYKSIVSTDKAPRAVGPYSQAIRAGNLLFISGQISIDPETQAVQHFNGDVKKQTERSLTNLRGVLESQMLSLGNVLKTTIYLLSMDDFESVNEIYSGFFPSDPPARATVAVVELPKGVKVEIEAVAGYPVKVSDET